MKSPVIPLALTRVNAGQSCRGVLEAHWSADDTLDALFLPPFSELHRAPDHLTMFPCFPRLVLCSFCN
jgi:hypothetical protein